MLSLAQWIKHRSAALVGGRFERRIKALYPSRRFFAVSNTAALFIGTLLMVQGQARTQRGVFQTSSHVGNAGLALDQCLTLRRAFLG